MARPTRVTLINLWPTGGMMHYASALANALARRPEVQLTLLVPREADTSRLDPTVEVAQVDIALRHGLAHAPGNIAQLLRFDRLWRAVQRTRPDVLHFNSSHPWLVPTAGALARRWPMVATVHEVNPHAGENTLRKRLETNAILRHAARFAVHGAQLKSELLERCPRLRPEDVAVTPHGVYDFFAENAGTGNAETEGATKSPARPTVLFFGRILSYKGLGVLLQAAPIVRRSVPDVRFVIAGEGNIEPYRALAADSSMIEMRSGYVPESEVAELFQDATVLALPYTEASWSGVASIAHAFALPVVATSVGCLPDAVQHGRNGLIVSPKDVVSLADALVAVLTDEQLRGALCRGARETCEHGWDQAAETLTNVYENVRP